jgi:hypothetical protein
MFEVGQAPVDHEKHILNGVRQLILRHSQAAQRSPNELHVSVVDLVEIWDRRRGRRFTGRG